MQANQSRKRPKAAGKSQLAARPLDCQLQGPSAPPPYVQRYHSDSFISKEEQRKVQQAFPVFEGTDGGRIHALVEYIQIKELVESVRNYGVNANFTVAQVKRLATLAMTPGDWMTVVKAACQALQTVEKALQDAQLQRIDESKSFELCVLKTAQLPTAVLWQN